jgi:hypothetical protein
VHVFQIPIIRLDPHNNSSTGSDGDIITTTIQAAVIITPPVDASSGGGGRSHTGAIAGGIAGGIAGLVAILLIGLFCWRRNRSRRDDLNGNFDPDSVVRHVGATDLTGAGVMSYHEPGAVGVGAAASAGQHWSPSSPGSPSSSGGGSMRQYHDSEALLAGSAGAATASSRSQYARTSSNGALVYPANIAHSSQQKHVVGMSVPQPYRPMSTKEEEVIHHTDGGQIPDTSVAPGSPHEVPPTYDSIPL